MMTIIIQEYKPYKIDMDDFMDHGWYPSPERKKNKEK